jgi:fatty-acyl-CoA synthase
MAALVVNAEFDLEAFRLEVCARLPPYARPLFLRLLPAIESTATFKPRRLELMREGYDPAQISDPLYVDDARSGAYVPLDRERHAAIAAGRSRF